MTEKKAVATDTVLATHNRVNDLIQRTGFYRDEVRIYEHRLEEVVKKNTRKDILAQAEQFQNQFILEKEQLDVLDHEANLLKDVVEKLGKEPAWAALRLEKGRLEEKLLAMETKHQETRGKFYRFLAAVY